MVVEEPLTIREYVEESLILDVEGSVTVVDPASVVAAASDPMSSTVT
jgi:hypothetical protein